MNASVFGKANTKGLIIKLLSEAWPMSVKKIYFGVKKASRKALTYQAVYKSVNELLSDGVLSKNGKEYLISPVWVETSGDFISRLSEAYQKSDLKGGRGIQELNFGSLSEAWGFLFSKLNTGFFGESAEAYFQIRRFFLFPISKEDIDRLKEVFSRKKVYIMCRENSVVDKLVAGFLTSLGAHVFTGVECARPTNVLVNGDCVISFYILGESERGKLSEYYVGTKNMVPSGKNIFKSFGSIFFKKIKVKLIINRDPGVLSDVLEQTKAILSKKRY